MPEPVVAATWPAAVEAARLLAALGASVMFEASGPALRRGSCILDPPASSVTADWAGSGAMELTGHPNQPPLHPVGRPATVAKAAALALELLTGTAVDGPALLGQRAALMGLTRQGRIAAGGGSRLLRSADGWWALNLARDGDLVPALTESDEPDDQWQVAEQWSARLPTAGVIGRATLLGLAAGGLGETATEPTSHPFRITRWPTPPRSRHILSSGRPPVVVNLGALWAGPLTGHLLGLAGARVIDVESSTRPDPTRISSPEFYRLLHAGHEQRVLDFSQPGELAELIRSADVVIEASRPRALAALGIRAEQVMADGGPACWLRITGHRDPSRVAFGDDAAVAGGLVAWDRDGPVFAGDAIADPLTGLLGALAVSSCLLDPARSLIKLALADVAAYCANAGTGSIPGQLR